MLFAEAVRNTQHVCPGLPSFMNVPVVKNRGYTHAAAEPPGTHNEDSNSPEPLWSTHRKSHNLHRPETCMTRESIHELPPFNVKHQFAF